MDAISLKQRRDNLNFLKNPRERPVNWQRLRSLTGQEFLGILFNSVRALLRSSSERFILRIIFLRAWRLSHFSFTSLSRCFSFSTDDVLAIDVLFFQCRAFLPLLTVGIFFVDNVKASLTAHDHVALGLVSLN